MKLIETLRQLKIWGFRGVLEAVGRLPHERAIRRFFLESARRYANTVPSKGITIIAPMSGGYSLSKTMRDFVLCLREANVPHQVFDTFKYDGRVAREDYEFLLTPKGEFNVLKYEFVVEMLTSPLPTGLPVKRCRIAFWEGESGLLEVFPYLKNSYAVIAMSDFNASYFRRVLPAHVRVEKLIYPLLPMPQGVLDKESARKRFGIGLGDFVVFYNFDIRADYRKNPQGTLEAFSSACKGVESCKLVLKVNGSADCPEKVTSLRNAAIRLGISRQLVLIAEYLSQIDIYSLTNSCDVYLSLHRAEGFGLGIAEAMQLGKAVVVTDYSANREFCTKDTSILVPSNQVMIGGEGFARHMKSWAEPDIVFAAEALVYLRNNPAEREELGRKARQFVAEHFCGAEFRKSIGRFIWQK